MLRCCILCILATICILGAAPLSASTELVAGVFHLKPYGFLDESQRKSGIIPDVIEELQKKTGLIITMKLLPYKRMVHELQMGSIDFAIFFKTKANSSFANPIAKVHRMPVIIIGRKGVELATYDDLSKYSISVTLGVSYEDRFDADKNLNKVPVKKYINQFHLFKNKHVDLVTGSKIGLFYNMSLAGIQKAMLGKPYILNYKEVWLQSPKNYSGKNKKELDQLSKAVNDLRKDGTISQIYNRSIY